MELLPTRWLGRRRFAARAGLVTVSLVLLCSGCVLPARSSAAFEGKAVESAKTAAGAVATARLCARQASSGKLTAAFASVTMADAEKDANDAQSSFDSIQPPDHRSDRLRDRLDSILSKAVSALARLRIDARRGHLAQLEHRARALQTIAKRLEQFQQAHS
ncbi:MAG TPA: hypothetical protein VFC99_06505 [Acidimicrobiia bacterium]|nr:hypothetical protein [Acidimicrobiia bacterium]